MDINVYKVTYKGVRHLIVAETREPYLLNVDILFPLMTYVNVIDEEGDNNNYTSIIRSKGDYNLGQCLGVNDETRHEVIISPITVANFNNFVKKGAKVMLAELEDDSFYQFTYKRAIASCLRYILNVK